MGIDTIRLDQEHSTVAGALGHVEIVNPSFSLHSVPSPAMSIWLMSMPVAAQAFPWWRYGQAVDEDFNKLAALTGISSAFGLLDFLFLLQLKRAFPENLYAIVPGNVRTEGWSNLNEQARSTFQRGQSCVYRLEAALGKKMNVNWVPFYQPQCIVRDASGENLIRFFNAAKSDDVANSLSFFSLSDVRKLPSALNLLVQKDDNRSEKMAEVVDWFGVYSSPRDDKHGTCALAYTTSKAAVTSFMTFEQTFAHTVETVRRALEKEPTPATVLKLLSRFIAL